MSQKAYITTDSENRPHVVWTTDIDNDTTLDEIFYTKLEGEFWTEPVNVSNTPSWSTWPVIGADRRNNIHLTFGNRTGPRYPAPYYQPPTDIFYRVLSNSSWSDMDSVYHTDSQFGYPPLQSMDVDSLGRVFLAWTEPIDDTTSGAGFESKFFFKFRFRDSTGWYPLQHVYQGFTPALRLDGRGRIHIV